MARKLKLRIELRSSAKIVVEARAAAEEKEDEWPDGWEPFSDALERAFDDVVAEVHALQARLDELDASDAIGWRGSDDEDPDAAEEWIEGWDVDVDLGVMRGDVLADDLTMLWCFVHWVNASKTLLVEDIRLGNKIASDRELVAELKRAAREIGVRLPSVGAGAGTATGATGSNGHASASHANGRSSGSWGDADFDSDDPPHASPEPPKNGRLHDHELAFLQWSELSWPCTAAEVRVAFKKLAFERHPDRQPGNPQAANVFRIVNDGFQRLWTRLTTMGAG